VHPPDLLDQFEGIPLENFDTFTAVRRQSIASHPVGPMLFGHAPGSLRLVGIAKTPSGCRRRVRKHVTVIPVYCTQLVLLQILIRNIVLWDLTGVHFLRIFIVGRLHTRHRTGLKDVSLFD